MTMAVAGLMAAQASSGLHHLPTHPEHDEASRGKGGFVDEGGGSTVGRAGRLSDHT